MATKIRYRSNPLQIRLYGGPSHGTGAAFGAMAQSLTQTLHQFQDVEAIKKLAEGDPETYLAYWKMRQKTLKEGSLHDTFETYALKAQAKIKEDEADSKAIASYARTNNHQAYLDYLVSKLDKTTDPAKLAVLTTQVNVMRGRVFKAGSGSAVLGGGVTHQELDEARRDWSDARAHYNGVIQEGGTLSDADVADLKKIKDRLSGDLKKIEDDTNSPSKARMDANKERTGNAEGTDGSTFSHILVGNDKNAYQEWKRDKDYDTLIENAKAKGDNAKLARLYADKANSLTVLMKTMQTSSGMKEAAADLKTTEKLTGSVLAQIETSSRNLPASAQTDFDSLFNLYEKNMNSAGALGTTHDKSKFMQELRDSPDLDTFLRNVKYVGSKKLTADTLFGGGDVTPQSAFSEYKNIVTQNAPASWDVQKGQWIGAKERVAEAQAAVDVARTMWNVPGSFLSPWKQAYDASGRPEPTDSDLAFILSGQATLPPPKPQTQPGDNEEFQATQPGAALNPATPANAAPGASSGGPQLPPDVAERATPLAPPDATQAGIPSNNQAGIQDLQPHAPDSNQEFSEATQAADNFLTQYDTPNLPDFKPPDHQADWESAFPFSTSRGGWKPPEISGKAGVPS